MLKKRIGEILIEYGAITRDQLGKALAEQKKQSGKLLGKVLIDMGFVTEEDIVVALATQFNVPYLPIGNVVLNEDSGKLIPKELIQKYLCIPLERISNLLTVVMADPTNENAIQEIEEATKSKVQAFVASSSEIAAVLRQHFHLEVLSTPELGESLGKPKEKQK